MKKLTITAALFAMGAFAETWTGTITDANCGAKHADASEKSMACAKRCVEGGAAAVFVVGDKVIKFDAASKAAIAPHIGHKVVIDGSLKDDTVTVASIKMAE